MSTQPRKDDESRSPPESDTSTYHTGEWGSADQERRKAKTDETTHRDHRPDEDVLRDSEASMNIRKLGQILVPIWWNRRDGRQRESHKVQCAGGAKSPDPHVVFDHYSIMKLQVWRVHERGLTMAKVSQPNHVVAATITVRAILGAETITPDSVVVHFQP